MHVCVWLRLWVCLCLVGYRALLCVVVLLSFFWLLSCMLFCCLLILPNFCCRNRCFLLTVFVLACVGSLSCGSLVLWLSPSLWLSRFVLSCAFFFCRRLVWAFTFPVFSTTVSLSIYILYWLGIPTCACHGLSSGGWLSCLALLCLVASCSVFFTSIFFSFPTLLFHNREKCPFFL